MKRENMDIIIDFEPISRRVTLKSYEKTLFEILTEINIKIKSLCGGLGTCGKCIIRIQEGNEYLNALTEAEKKFLTNDQIKNGSRLACQTKIDSKYVSELIHKPTPQIRVYLPENLLIEDFSILTSGIGKGVDLNPTIEKILISVEKPNLEKPMADYERILKAIFKKNLNLSRSLKIEYNLLKKIPNLLRNEKNEITVTIWDGTHIIDLEYGNKVSEKFGIAFDIGTTTIVGYLINLYNQKIYAVHSKLNPQTAYGEDVVTRITYIKDNEKGLDKLHLSITDALNSIIDETCQDANVLPNQIYEATIVGNSVMHHIALGLNPIHIGLSPYVPIIQQGINIEAKNIGLNISKNGNIYALPLIAGFVGADTMGVILSSELYKEKALTLAIDIGTNGEIIIGNKDVLITGSCAAGSALEGAHITHGMRAAGGAIESVNINPDTLEVSYKTIKNKKAIGICGSGLIDIVAEMLKSKILTRSGNFNKEIKNNERFIDYNDKKEFVIAFGDQTPLDTHISVSLQDIRQIQMAKAAFYSGTRLMLEHLNKTHNKTFEIEQIFLAGAFGNYIDKENARFIGMIPDIESENIFQIGNAAGLGAQYCLINKDYRKKAMDLLKKIEYIEIAVKERFQREYAEAMYFPHMNLDLFPHLEQYKNIPKR
ncbi:MAG: ASKHA domain-containing protein [Promethearchaeati archaeon]